ncbi:MAG: hypothetical protein ABI678_25820 [Kofleriaceae bacterium]
MAQLRLIVLALASCAASEAAPAPDAIAVPKGWVADPSLAKAASAAAGPAVTRSDAWSDPARGCYALVLDLHGGAVAIDVAADQLLAALGEAGVKPHEVVKPGAGPAGVLTLGLDRGTYRGKLRAELVQTGEVHALACVWNQREPKVCEAGCATLFGGPR